MNESYDKKRAVVCLPAAGGARIASARQKRWLARSAISLTGGVAQPLERILSELAMPGPVDGLAALRMWGQTGDRPSTWIAAADPVYLEPQLDRLRLHVLRSRDLSASDLSRLVDHLQRTLGEECGIMRLGQYLYLASGKPLATAALPPEMLDQQVPTEYLPGGDNRASHRRLLSEIEMALHDHDVNVERQTLGRPIINSLWIWGGGYAPVRETREMPVLFSDDPLIRGFWNSQSSLSEPWPGNFETCIEKSTGQFVAVLPDAEGDGQKLDESLAALHAALHSNRVSELVLLFEDGLRAAVRKSHGLRFWRRSNPLLDAGAA